VTAKTSSGRDKKLYSKEELIGRQVVVVDNLDPVILRGSRKPGYDFGRLRLKIC